MGRAFEYRKAAKLKRWGHMAKTFTRLGKQIAREHAEGQHRACHQECNG